MTFVLRERSTNLWPIDSVRIRFAVDERSSFPILSHDPA